MSNASSQLDTGILIRRSLFFLILIILTLGNLFVLFRGLNSPQAMDQAQIAREIARGNGFTTKMIRPVAYYQAEKAAETLGPARRLPGHLPLAAQSAAQRGGAQAHRRGRRGRLADGRKRNGLSARPRDRHGLHAVFPDGHRGELSADLADFRRQDRRRLRHPDAVLRDVLELLAQRAAADADAAAVFLRHVFRLSRRGGRQRGTHRHDAGRDRRRFLHAAGAHPLGDGLDRARLHHFRGDRLPAARHRRHLGAGPADHPRRLRRCSETTASPARPSAPLSSPSTTASAAARKSRSCAPSTSAPSRSCSTA